MKKLYRWASDYTAEELFAISERTENFYGKTMDMALYKQFIDMEQDALDWMNGSDKIMRVWSDGVRRDEPNSCLKIEILNGTAFVKEDMEYLMKFMNQSNSLVLYRNGDDTTRIIFNFAVLGIWKD